MGSPDFNTIVSEYYEPLYRFAFSLAGIEAEAQDLTQQTFYVWATKGHQLRDKSKVKTWLFTTLHRGFLESRRRRVRFPHFELMDSNVELPTVTPETIHEMDCAEVVKALGELDDIYQAAVALFYLEDLSYKEIAEVLQIPIGTVKSRLSRGLIELRKILMSPPVDREQSSADCVGRD